MQTIFQPEMLADDKKRVFELEKMKKSLELQLQEMAKTVEKQQEMIAMARRDPLTGLRNRDGVSEQVNALLQQACEGTFFIMDMDNFKSVNDTYGHIEGDRVLVRFAGALRKSIDAEDIVARLGGDEFVVFSPGYKDKYEVKAKAQRIIRQIERALVTPGRLLRVTVSMGIARAPRSGVTYEALYGNADKALYAMKSDGKNGYKFYEDLGEAGSNAVNSSRLQISLAEITTRLREKKMEGSFVVEYSNFEKIYRFMERNLIREKREVQCVLFTLDDDMEADDIALQRQLEHLQHAVTTSLRKGDVTTNYSSSQVLALLMDVNKENAEMVINRILAKYRMESGEDAMKITYDAEQLMASEDTIQ